MIISDRKVNNLVKDGIIVPSYRVLSSHEVCGNPSNRYVYYSITLKHHIYFLVKKIFKKIEACYDISISNPRDKHLVDKINDIMSILESDKSFTVGVKYLWIDAFTMKTIEDNSYSNKYPHKNGLIERADSTIYGGGYGLNDLWLTLFNLLTYCAAENILKSDDVLRYFDELSSLLKKYGSSYLKIAKQEAAKSILRDKTPAIVCPSIIEDSSSKIESTIDEIVTNNLFKTNSALAKDSSKVKDDIINHYDSSRKLILKRLKK